MPHIEMHMPTVADAVERSKDSMHHAVQASLTIYSASNVLDKILQSRLYMDDSGRLATAVNENDSTLQNARSLLKASENAARDAQRILTEAIELMKTIE